MEITQTTRLEAWPEPMWRNVTPCVDSQQITNRGRHPQGTRLPAHSGTYALAVIRGPAAHIESRMGVKLSRSLWVGWTGLGRATPCGGQARIRSHRPMSVGGWESAGHYQDSIQGCVSRLLGQTPTRFVCVLNYPSLLDKGQGVVHSTAMVR